MAPPITGASPLSPDYDAYWQSANRAAEPIQASLRRRLPHFPSPPLRIQRVSQLDAEILDTELTSMLLEPLKLALRNIKSTLPLTLEPEMLLALRLILYKFSIYERGTTYGAMLQNLRYRNEWAHSGGLQSTSRDASLSRLQLTLFPALTILLPYFHNKVERRMSHLSYSDMPYNDTRRLLWNGMNQLQRVYAALSLANFLAFLSNGSSRIGLYRDEKGKAKIRLPFNASKALAADSASAAKYPDLPESVCAICWERLEDEAGIRSSGQSMIRSGIPSSDPLDPSSNALAPSVRSSQQHQHQSSSSSGLAYADAQIHTSYQANPCGHTYCYVCIAGKLLSEEAAEEIAESAEDGEEGVAWRCLRCAKGVRSAQREQQDEILTDSVVAKQQQGG
ncbi:hypothetical protein CBS101457_001714 [Exobasidium rhododendri]|nr:hypothetical protein CBS101457_001714 [Exobasidium rhododendri]